MARRLTMASWGVDFKSLSSKIGETVHKLREEAEQGIDNALGIDAKAGGGDAEDINYWNDEDEGEGWGEDADLDEALAAETAKAGEGEAEPGAATEVQADAPTNPEPAAESRPVTHESSDAPAEAGAEIAEDAGPAAPEFEPAAVEPTPEVLEVPDVVVEGGDAKDGGEAKEEDTKAEGSAESPPPPQGDGEASASGDADIEERLPDPCHQEDDVRVEGAAPTAESDGVKESEGDGPTPSAPTPAPSRMPDVPPDADVGHLQSKLIAMSGKMASLAAELDDQRSVCAARDASIADLNRTSK